MTATEAEAILRAAAALDTLMAEFQNYVRSTPPLPDPTPAYDGQIGSTILILCNARDSARDLRALVTA